MRISRITYGFWFNHFVFPFFLISLMLGYKDLHINWAWQFTEYLKFNKRFQSPLKFELDNWKSPLLTLELQNVPRMTHLYSHCFDWNRIKFSEMQISTRFCGTQISSLQILKSIFLKTYLSNYEAYYRKIKRIPFYGI